MEQSILLSTKKLLGIDPADTSFDLDIITHINSAFSVLTDVGVGPEHGFVIEDETLEWAAFFTGAAPDPNDPGNQIKLSKVKTCVFLRTKLLFDAPVQSSLLDAIKAQIEEAEWRLNVNREAIQWVDPLPLTPPEDEEVFSGGFGL